MNPSTETISSFQKPSFILMSEVSPFRKVLIGTCGRSALVRTSLRVWRLEYRAPRRWPFIIYSGFSPDTCFHSGSLIPVSTQPMTTNAKHHCRPVDITSATKGDWFPQQQTSNHSPFSHSPVSALHSLTCSLFSGQFCLLTMTQILNDHVSIHNGTILLFNVSMCVKKNRQTDVADNFFGCYFTNLFMANLYICTHQHLGLSILASGKTKILYWLGNNVFKIALVELTLGSAVKTVGQDQPWQQQGTAGATWGRGACMWRGGQRVWRVCPCGATWRGPAGGGPCSRTLGCSWRLCGRHGDGSRGGSRGGRGTAVGSCLSGGIAGVDVCLRGNAGDCLLRHILSL